jgi:heptosyltransferase-2
MKKILIVNPFGIGDVIFSTPLIEILKNSHPDLFIGYVCNKRAYEVIRSDQKIDRFFIYEKDEYRAIWKKSKIRCAKQIIDFLNGIKKERFNAVIDLSLGYQSGLLLKIIGIRNRFGFNYRKRGRFLTGKIDMDGFSEKHVIEYYCDILKFFGIDPQNYILAPKVYLADQDARWADNFMKENAISGQDLMVGVVPGCGASWGQDAKYRRWEKEKFARVADTLAEKYKAKVILFGDSKDVELCNSVKSIMEHDAVLTCGKTTIGEFLCLASRCALIVTNDGGPLHMSASLGVKTVSIFGPVDEKVYGPYPPSVNHLTITARVPCRPCYKNFKYVKCERQECLRNIKVEDVVSAADALLKGRD